MASTKLHKNEINLTADISELNQHQVRLLKNVVNMLTHVMTTDEEADYFDSSSELMRVVATAVKKSNFTKYFSENQNIEYGSQALEYCVDALSDQVYAGDVVKFDN